ncbi:hypothetical protein HNV11_02405 [Spirosoma taeanense]|uniref:Uncharacterized protein n=1 Tax=Spirosoma taeanense TaxID=2735870 RepID=A0A6M5Y3J3_9BACT|nr:hypothetical protein [Spirosoma taeanense]QJW88305.1 hypothetical protein HNV11_02405 [Spirosoma taeanense]
MRLTRFSFWLPVCIAFFAFCCLVDLVLLTIDGDHALPVEVQLTTVTARSVTAIDVYRISPGGTPSLLTLKRTGSANQLFVRSEAGNLYYKGLQLTIPDSVLPAVRQVGVRVGDRLFAYLPAEVVGSWQVTERVDGRTTYAFPAEVVGVTSFIPVFQNVFNWAGDPRLIQAVILNNLPILALLLIVAGLYSKRGQRFQRVFQDALLAHQGNRAVGVAVVGAVLYRMPYELQPIETGVDPSWILGLNWASNEGFRWGQDFVFTYGPYYWLMVPNLLLRQPVLLLSFGLTLLIFGFSIGIIVRQLLNQLRANRLTVPIAALLLLLLFLADYSVMDAVVVGVLLLLVRGRHSHYLSHTLPAATLLALLSLTKFSYFAVALVMLIVHSLACVTERDVRVPIRVWLTYLSAGVLLWLAAGQPLPGLVGYITGGFDIASGYSEAMATPLWNENSTLVVNSVGLLFLAAAVILLAGIGLILLLAFLKSKDWLFALLLTTPILFLAFKEGYIRFDRIHFSQFFEQWLVVIIGVYLLAYPWTARLFVRGFAGLSLVATLAIIGFRAPHYSADLAGVFSASVREDRLLAARQQLRAVHGLDTALVQELNASQSADVLPWDITLLYAYELPWRPRPIIQSYAAFTTKLDSLNTQSYRQADAPEQLLYSFKAIDNRYPLFDEPMLFAELMRRYRTVGCHGDAFLLLRKRQQPTPAPDRQSVSSHLVKFGQNVNVPRLPNQLVFAKIDINLTLLGRVLNFLYKVPPLQIEFVTTTDATPRQARLVRRTATDGLLVSTYLKDLESVQQLFDGRSAANVRSLTLIGNSWVYQPTVALAFYSQPIITSDSTSQATEPLVANGTLSE